MAEEYEVDVATVASGTDKTLVNLFNPVATPTGRGRITYVGIGSPAAPADQDATFYLGRTTAVGTEGSGLVPHNTDPVGPAGEYDSGLGVYSVEPTYTANKGFFRLPMNQRATLQWYARQGRGFLMAATQNNGAGLKSTQSSSTQGHGVTILFEE